MLPVIDKLVCENPHAVHWIFYCPGCLSYHGFQTEGPGPRWDFNDSTTEPTFSPSLRVNGSDPDKRCHSFVRAGKIEFLHDCWHGRRDEVMDLEPIE